MFNNSQIFQNEISGTGSVGGFFRFPNSPILYGISNNHVIANLNDCNAGDPVFDMGANEIGALTHWVTLQNDVDNFVDAALFQCHQLLDPRWRIYKNVIAKPPGFIEPRLGGRVYLMRDNNVARWGTISEVATSEPIIFTHGGAHFSFSGLIEITPLDGKPFSDAGNSGSVILASNHAIAGLLIGIEKAGIKSYAVPFVNGILNYFPLLIA